MIGYSRILVVLIWWEHSNDIQTYNAVLKYWYWCSKQDQSNSTALLLNDEFIVCMWSYKYSSSTNFTIYASTIILNKLLSICIFVSAPNLLLIIILFYKILIIQGWKSWISLFVSIKCHLLWGLITPMRVSPCPQCMSQCPLCMSLCLLCVSQCSSILSCCRCVRRGIHDLKLWPGVVADGNVKTTTPGKPDSKSITEMNRLTKV